MDYLINWIEGEIGISPAVQGQIFKTIFATLIMFIIYKFIKRVLYRAIDNTKTYYRSKKAVSYIIIVLSFIIIARIWFVGISSVTTFLGLFTAALAIAMRDLIMNMAGWLYILWKRPFRVGDRIEIDNISGDVIDVQLFEFALMEIRNWVKADQSTGRIAHIPNRVVFNSPLFNYSKGIPYVWEEIPIHITFESNWKKAKKILEDIAYRHGESISEQAESSIKSASRKFVIFNAKLEPTVYTSIDNENCITLTMRYMCPYRKRRDSSHSIYEEVLENFNIHKDIEFAYPTQRVFDRPRDTKFHREEI